MGEMSRRRRPAIGLGFKVWFAFCVLLSLASLVGLGWLVVALIGYLDRH